MILFLLEGKKVLDKCFVYQHPWIYPYGKSIIYSLPTPNFKVQLIGTNSLKVSVLFVHAASSLFVYNKMISNAHYKLTKFCWNKKKGLKVLKHKKNIQDLLKHREYLCITYTDLQIPKKANNSYEASFIYNHIVRQSVGNCFVTYGRTRSFSIINILVLYKHSDTTFIIFQKNVNKRSKIVGYFEI